MRTVILYGGDARDAGPATALTLLRDTLHGAGAAVTCLRVAELQIRPCTGCFNCWLKTPGECCQPDDGRLVARALATSALTIFVTPVTFGGYSGALKTAVDRMVPNISPLFQRYHGEMHHRLRYPHPATLLAIGWQQTPDAEQAALFARLVERNALNMHAPAHGSLVLTAGQAPDEQRARMAELLRAVGGA